MYILEVQYLEPQGRGSFTDRQQYADMRHAEAALDKLYREEEEYGIQLLNWHILNR